MRIDRHLHIAFGPPQHAAIDFDSVVNVHQFRVRLTRTCVLHDDYTGQAGTMLRETPAFAHPKRVMCDLELFEAVF